MSSPSSLHESSPLPVSIYLSLSLLSLSNVHTHTLNPPNGNSCCTKAWLVRLQPVAPYTQHLSKIHHSLEEFVELFPDFSHLAARFSPSHHPTCVLELCSLPLVPKCCQRYLVHQWQTKGSQ